LIINDANNSGGLTVRHRERPAEPVLRGENDMDDRIYPMTFYALSTVLWAEVRGYLISGLHRDG
jgi:hypothetical protein